MDKRLGCGRLHTFPGGSMCLAAFITLLPPRLVLKRLPCPQTHTPFLTRRPSPLLPHSTYAGYPDLRPVPRAVALPVPSASVLGAAVSGDCAGAGGKQPPRLRAAHGPGLHHDHGQWGAATLIQVSCKTEGQGGCASHFVHRHPFPWVWGRERWFGHVRSAQHISHSYIMTMASGGQPPSYK